MLVEFRVIVTSDAAFGHDEDKNWAESISNKLHITMWHVLVLWPETLTSGAGAGCFSCEMCVIGQPKLNTESDAVDYVR